VSLHAANHDPAEFADPLALDLTRTPNRHIGFGGGAHYCLGAAVARMELQVALAALLERYSGIELAGEPVWRRSFIIRGLESLPLRLDATCGSVRSRRRRN
jgi:cytochrome P450